MARRRGRAMAVRRRSRWMRLVWGLMLFFVLILGWGGWRGVLALIDSDLLTARYIEIEGCRVIPEQRVRDILGPALGGALLRVDTDSLRREIADLPRVREVKLRRRLPGTLRCTVEEAEALALLSGESFRELSREGRLLERYGNPAPDLPIIRLSTVVGEDSLVTLAVEALLALESASFDLGREVSEMGVDEGGLFFLRNEGRTRVLLGWEQYAQCVAAYREVFPRLTGEKGFPRELDLRYRDQVVARP